MELVRDGHSLSSIMNLGRQMLGRRQVIPGIAEILEEVQVGDSSALISANSIQNSDFLAISLDYHPSLPQ